MSILSVAFAPAVAAACPGCGCECLAIKTVLLVCVLIAACLA